MPGIGLSKCVFITGGTSGIGRALGYKIKDLPSKPKVIMAGRRQERLDELAKDGFETVRMDLNVDRASLMQQAEQLIAKYPDLDTIILNAGIERKTDFTKGIDLDSAAEEMRVNYHSPLALITVFVPHLMKLGSQGRPTFLITVTSILGVAPAPQLAVYSSTKAALHILTLSLRVQLTGTGVNVLEIIPPLVESELHDAEGMAGGFANIWMPLDEYITSTMNGLIAGDLNICTGLAEVGWNQFEKGKDEMISAIQGLIASSQR